MPAEPPRGGRECLDQDQVVHLFNTLVRRDDPWAAVLMLMQMQCAERADCCRQSRRGWFHDLDPHAGQPANVQIPKVNGKTVPRTIPVHKTFADLLHQWLSGNPLKGPMSQWPWEGQDTQASTAMLFPGRVRGGVDNRHWGVSVSRRAYLLKVTAAAEDILAERAEHRRSGKPHPFDECDLTRLGTHSFKKTGVSLLRDVCRSIAVVSAISGTSGYMLSKVYDVPTVKRQRKALRDAFGCVFTQVNGSNTSSSAAGSSTTGGSATASAAHSNASFKFCPRCGNLRADPQWAWCPHCGHQWATHQDHDTTSEA